MNPLQYQSRDDLHTTAQNLADEPTLANGPQSPWVPEKRCLAYHYNKTWQTNLLWPMNPLQYQSRDDLHTTTQNLADEPTLANGPPSPWVPEKRCLKYHYTKLGRQTYFGQWTPCSTRAEMTCIPLHKTWQTNLLWPMDPPGTRAEITCIPLHKTWQMNLL